MLDAIIIISNLPDLASAEQLAKTLVERKLAACVNILPQVNSIYRWQGQIQQTAEVTVMIKTIAQRYDEIEVEIKATHPYDLPEIIALPITHGLPAYLDWIGVETKRDIHV
ncbi:divalent-cation tolerance protein CutA [Glaciimonas soli]|uniref:Divalent cation tolerance protein CutA n=1 Tax=Glaciimonas soli TaxID=2590999 RepID=A0A843YY47_9BURK|nr:divalent-cation tolerance protein CutA [Glaciimonas soli]MQR02703.1 divalent cation tolerance protein CutA [Glaciimonas soli]